MRRGATQVVVERGAPGLLWPYRYYAYTADASGSPTFESSTVAITRAGALRSIRRKVRKRARKGVISSERYPLS